MIEENSVSAGFLEGLRKHMTHAAARCQRIEGLSANDYMAGVLSDQPDICVRAGEIDLEACLGGCLVSCHGELKALLAIEIRFWIDDQEWTFCFYHGSSPPNYISAFAVVLFYSLMIFHI